MKQRGVSLAMLLQRRKISRENLITIIDNLVNETYKLHQANICLNYITLQNIFIDIENNKVYILDFRNAKLYIEGGSGNFEWRDDLLANGEVRLVRVELPEAQVNQNLHMSRLKVAEQPEFLLNCYFDFE